MWEAAGMWYFGQTCVFVVCGRVGGETVGSLGIIEKDKLFVVPPSAFIFYNHTHGREMLDVYVHKLLVLAAFLTGLVAFMEIIARTNIAVELLRTSFVLLQGSWFWQVSWASS